MTATMRRPRAFVGAGDVLDGSSVAPAGPGVGGSVLAGWVATAVAFVAVGVVWVLRAARRHPGELLDVTAFGLGVAACGLWWGAPGALAAASLSLHVLNAARRRPRDG